jgi:hypothetical protein
VLQIGLQNGLHKKKVGNTFKVGFSNWLKYSDLSVTSYVTLTIDYLQNNKTVGK